MGLMALVICLRVRGEEGRAQERPYTRNPDNRPAAGENLARP